MTNVANTSALLLITHRPEFTAPWLDQPHVTQLSVRRLSQLQVEEMILKAGGNDLSAQDLDHIVAHSDGVPLYIEELTHSAITVDDTAVETQIPASLQDSLNARLDRLGAAKRTAAIAAVIGREVPHELLVAVSGQTDDDLNRHIETLLASGIVQQNRRGSDTSYLFKHALVQDAAYQNEVIPADVPCVTVEAGITAGWERYAGRDGQSVGIDRFGASAPGAVVADELGLNVESVARSVRSCLA